MSTNQSGEKERGEYVTTQVCNATKEELLRGEKYVSRTVTRPIVRYTVY